MTTSQEPQAELVEAEVEEQDREALPQRPQRRPRPRRQRPEQNPALDPRLVQLERRSRRPSRAGDVSLMVIAVAAFIFGVAMHFWVATSILEDDGEAESSSNPVAATATPEDDAVTVTPTVGPRATETPLPDRTSCEEIRGTQYRSVSEREFFLANCTS